MAKPGQNKALFHQSQHWASQWAVGRGWGREGATVLPTWPGCTQVVIVEAQCSLPGSIGLEDSCTLLPGWYCYLGCCTVRMYHSWFSYSLSMDTYLGYCQPGAIINEANVDIFVQVFW